MIRVNLIHSRVGISTFPFCPSQLAFPQGLHVVRGDVRKATERVLAHLAASEIRALNYWEREDLRIAWLTVLHCSELKNFTYLTKNAHVYGKRVGEIVWEYAFWMTYGKVYDKAQILWAEQHEANEQTLARWAKKPCVSVPAEAGKKVA